jgi:succinoglycan biosynthesis transport protein ExoP
MIAVNQKIINTRSQLQTLNNEYVESGFDPSYQTRIDSLQRILTRLISQASDKYSVNPMTTKQALVQQKATLEVQGDIAKSSIAPVENELRRLDNKLNELVPHEAVVQSFESGIQIAKDEYMEILAKYNQTRLESNFVTKLQQIQVAMPGVAQPSKKMLLVILSGIITFVFCLVVLFLLMFIDDSLKTPRELANATKSPVLGHLYKLSGSTIDLKQVWEGHANQDEQAFKDLMQSIRFEVGNDLKDDKVLIVNSLTPSAGKTFVALNLAYAYAQVNKKVLLIDGNFKQPDITNAVNPKIFIEDYLSGVVYEKSLYTHQKVVVAGNRGSEVSPLQSETEQDLRTKFDQLKAYYDVIIIETAALSNLNKAKEWIAYADKILTVFKAGKSLKENDKLNIEYLKKQPDKFIGWVLNEVSKQQVATAK